MQTQGGTNEEGRGRTPRWPSRDKSKDIKIVPPRSLARLRGSSLAECITGRQRVAIKLSVILARDWEQLTGSGQQSGSLINGYWVSREFPRRSALSLIPALRKRFTPQRPLVADLRRDSRNCLLRRIASLRVSFELVCVKHPGFRKCRVPATIPMYRLVPISPLCLSRSFLRRFQHRVWEKWRI